MSIHLILLLAWIIIGAITMKMIQCAWNAYWYKQFGTHYYDDYPNTRINDIYMVLFSSVMGLIGAITSIFVFKIFNKNSEYFWGRSNYMVFHSKAKIEKLVNNKKK